MTANVSPCWLSLRAGGLFTRLARPSGGAIAVGLFLALLLVQGHKINLSKNTESTLL